MEINDLNITGTPQKLEAAWVIEHLDNAASFIRAVNKKDSHFLGHICYRSDCDNVYELVPGWIEGDEVIYYNFCINGQSIIGTHIIASYCTPEHALWYKGSQSPGSQ